MNTLGEGVTELPPRTGTAAGRQLSVSVIIPAYNAAEDIRECLAKLHSGTRAPDEIIVVDDGSTDRTAEMARLAGVTVVATGGRKGPGFARNMGAERAQGDVLLFVDADVCVLSGTVERVAAKFQSDPSLAALMGAYDESPTGQDLLSQYRNLMHCYTHRVASHSASTFWTGCGAVRANVFRAVDGFDVNCHAMEDVDLGYRLAGAGHRIELDPTIEAKHRKRWTFLKMVLTDMFDRGVPWTLIILRAKRMPNDLNLKWHLRASVLGVGLMAFLVALGSAHHGLRFFAPLFGVTMVIMGAFWVSEALAPGRRIARVGLMGSVGGYIWLAWAADLEQAIVPVLVAYSLLFARELLTTPNGRAKRITGLLYGLYLTGCLVYLLALIPRDPITLALLVISASILLLNSRFYLFLLRRLGKLWGLAAIPFHFLFHFYSGISFGLGSLQYHMERRGWRLRSGSAARSR